MAKKPTTKKEVERNKRSNQIDDDSLAMIVDGCNLTQLGKLFRMERRDITVKITNVSPCGTRGGYPIYHVHEVAPYLVKPLYDVEKYLRRMNPKDLPKEVTREFWAGMKSRLEFMEKESELWPTIDVINVLTDVFKQFRMSMLLIPDALERESSLNDSQRSAIQGLIDGALTDVHDGLVKKFEPLAETMRKRSIVDDEDEL